MLRCLCGLAPFALMAACGGGNQVQFFEANLTRHINALADDSTEGRSPGTMGEVMTVRYLIQEFEKLGLAPGNPDGGWTQSVGLVAFTTTPIASFRVGSQTIPLTNLTDYVAVTRRAVPELNVNASEIVFVGYGVVAPEYQWDDFKDVDVRGKTVVMLVNDPAVALAGDSTQVDPALFRGNAMTYYGRWAYKYEIASERGAAAAIIIHETGPAGYPWEVVSGSWGGENHDVVHADGSAGRVGVESWMTGDKARELFRAAGYDFDALKAAARRRDFRPVVLGATATFHLMRDAHEVQSNNVIAKLAGSDSALASEYVIFSAHWDHLGRDTTLVGDQIYNGALDNASGTASMLELAREFAELPTAPKRTILFLAVTAEESGLLGSRFYASNPLYPLNRTVANVNLDGINQWGRTSDITVIGSGNTTLEDVLAEEAATRDRTVSADPEPEKGLYYRSDHFEFAKRGVPAMFLDSGIHFIGRPENYGQIKRDEWVDNDYHKPSDQVKPDWDLSGAIADLELIFAMAARVANEPAWPEWKDGTEFKAVRDAALRAAPR